MNPLRWLRDNAQVYLGNATARRDYRAQLRGAKAIYFWGAYLLILVLLAGLTYSAAVDRGEQPVADLQHQLRSFYFTTIRLLGVLIFLIAPALTAGTIVSEKMMKSLDLIFTSPMTPKHLLVGKMISSFRYTWMLLILALPITAVSVVMGGATWVDVLAAYVILSASALLVTSIGLLISTLVNTPVAAVLWTYVSVSAYAFLVSSFAAGYEDFTRMTGPSDQAAPWTYALSPFWAAQAAPTHTVVGNWHVPNFVFAVIFALLVSKLMLLGAASAMSPYGAKETKSLRIHLLLYTFAASYGLISSSSPSGRLDEIGWIALALCVFLPFLVCASKFGDRKYRFEGPFNLVGAIDGRPSGSLLYLWLLAVALCGGGMLVQFLRSGQITGVAYITLLWIGAFWTFWWALARALSLVTAELRACRMLLLMSMLLLMGLPIPFATMSGTNQLFEHETIWRYYILFPLGNNGTNMQVAGSQHAIGLLLVASVIAIGTELIRRRQYRVAKVAA